MVGVGVSSKSREKKRKAFQVFTATIQEGYETLIFSIYG